MQAKLLNEFSEVVERIYVSATNLGHAEYTTDNQQ